jgi:NitT/TauT family transport system ATP-binding protein
MSEVKESPHTTIEAIRTQPRRVAGIEVRSASKAYQSGRREVVALQPVSLDINEGSFVAVVGRSGCGKSTLLRLLAGLLAPSMGSVRVGGEPAALRPPRTARFIFQDYATSLLPWKTVAHNVAFGIRHAVGAPAERFQEDPEYFLHLVGLGDEGSKYPWQLSGGMQQRVAIARAIASRPRFLFMDEPFSAVDALSRARLQDITLRIWAELGLTIVFVTHDMDEAVYLADRVLVMAPAGGGILEDVPVGLPRPRDAIFTREMPAFLDHRRQLLRAVLAPGGIA